jgi:outer membrane biosynthesis protein TonB
MTRPDDDRTVEQPVVEAPSVSTAPPPSRPHRWWSSIPSHLGRARTSTVVMAALFLAIGALYLNVRPDPVAPGNTGTTVQTPTTPRTTTPAPTTTAPETTAPAPTTEELPTPTEDLPTTTTTTEPPVETTEPTPEPTPTEEPTGTPGPTPPPEPSTLSPPG